MTAKELVTKHGSALVGRLVLTQPNGEYPGGIAEVVRIAPDPNAPEIVFDVKTDEWDIGVFEHETVHLIES